MAEETAGQAADVVASIAQLRGAVVQAIPTGTRAVGDAKAAVLLAVSEVMHEAENVLVAFEAAGAPPATLFPHYRAAMHKLGEARERLCAVEGVPAMAQAADALGAMIVRLDSAAKAHKSPGVAGGVVYGEPVRNAISLPAAE